MARVAWVAVAVAALALGAVVYVLASAQECSEISCPNGMDPVDIVQRVLIIAATAVAAGAALRKAFRRR